MGRGVRHFVLGVVAFALCGRAPQARVEADQTKAERNQFQPATAITANAQTLKPVEPPEYYRPCRNDRQDGNSNLCAQWTAAEGANDAAYWAEWGFWISFLGIGGLLATLYYTRKAVLAAEEGTRGAARAIEVARDGNKISEEIGKAQSRAYLSVTNQHVSYEHGEGFKFEFDVVNSGQSPARLVNVRLKLHVMRDDKSEFGTHLVEELGDIPVTPDGKPVEFPKCNLPLDLFSQRPGPGAWILCKMVVTYTTVFKETLAEHFDFEVGIQKDLENLSSLKLAENGFRMKRWGHAIK